MINKRHEALYSYRSIGINLYLATHLLLRALAMQIPIIAADACNKVTPGILGHGNTANLPFL